MAEKRARAGRRTGLGRVDASIVQPKGPGDCPFAGSCRSKRCKAKERCVRIARMCRAAERAYRALPQYREEYGPLVREAVLAQLVIAALDHKLRASGLAIPKRDGKLKANELLRERRQWASLLVRLHSEMCLTPKSLSARERSRQPTGLLAAMIGEELASEGDGPPGETADKRR